MESPALSYNVRTFRARSMSDALAAVKRELGPDAVILGTRTLPAGRLTGWARHEPLEITAAPPNLSTPAPRLRAAPRSGSLPSPAAAGVPPRVPEHLYPYFVQLVQQDVAEELAGRLVLEATAKLPGGIPPDDDAVRAAVRDYIARMLPPAPGVTLPPDAPWRVALVGPSGSGKSTTVAKLAALFKLRRQQPVALLSLDTQRLDAHTHLQRYANVLDVPLHTAQTIAEVKAALKHLAAPGLVLIDTPGVGLREQARFARLATLLRAAHPDEVHLVLPASLDARVQARTAREFAPLGVSRLVLTRLDDALGFGVVLNTITRLSLGVSYLATGQNVPQDIEEACGSRVAELVCAADG